MKLLLTLLLITLLSCSRDLDINDCDEVTYVRDNYQSGIIAGYMYISTDTIYHDSTICGATLDSLLLVANKDSINGNNLYTYRYIFKNHHF